MDQQPLVAVPAWDTSYWHSCPSHGSGCVDGLTLLLGGGRRGFISHFPWVPLAAATLLPSVPCLRRQTWTSRRPPICFLFHTWQQGVGMMCLASFLPGQAQMAILRPHSWLAGASSGVALQLFQFLVQVRLSLEFEYSVLQ